MAREVGDAVSAPRAGPEPTGAENPPASAAVAFGPYLLRPDLRRLERNGTAVKLGDRAFDLLCVLTEHAGEILTHRELMDRVWGPVVVGAGSLRFHINALRNVLAEDGSHTPYIKNVTRRGYTFIAPVRRLGGSGRTAGMRAIERLLQRPQGHSSEVAALIALILEAGAVR
jgi:DNA-binding winged helix-turn-helix (wHTH) protein